MAKNERQAEINNQVMKGLELWNEGTVVNGAKLGHCNAEIHEFNNDCLALISHGTVVAVFDRFTGCFYDALRYTYGYNCTSARHIARFRYLLRNSITKEFRYYHI